MHIAFDCSGITCPFNSTRGIGRYTRHHLAHLLESNDEIQLTLLHETSADLTLLGPFIEKGAKIKSYDALKNLDFDILHIPDPMTIIAGRPTLLDHAPEYKTTVTFYDLIPLVLAEQHFYYYSAGLSRAYLKRLAQVRNSAKKVFAISNNTRNDLLRITEIEPQRIVNIQAGSNLTNETQTTDLVEGLGAYFLVVGGLDSHKGFHHTFAALQNLVREQIDVKIVVAGSTNDSAKAIYQQLSQQLKISQHLVFTDFVSDQELSSLYSHAIALVYPSDYEGFGFPVLEAMTRGCPVITRRNASLEEVGGNAVFYIEETPLEEIMKKLLHTPSLRQELREKGLRQSKLFSWTNVAATTLRTWRTLRVC